MSQTNQVSPPEKKTRKRKPGKIYFSEETQDAIVRYNHCDDIERSRIFQKHIYPALDKLSENLINTYKFHKYETNYSDLKYNIVSFLHDKLPTFTQDRGKAFSYLTICALNYLKMNSNQMKARQKFINDVEVIDYKRDLDNEYFEERRIADLRNFINLWIEWNYSNLETMYKPNREQKIVDAVLTLFNSTQDLECFHKKYIYVLIREQTDFTTSQITAVIKKLKFVFTRMFSEYNAGGYIWPKVKSYKEWKEMKNEKII